MKVDIQSLSIPLNLYDAFHKIWKKAGNVYLVGGAVRDFKRGKMPKDLDFCVTGLSWEEMEETFPDNKVQGISFPVFNIEKCEFALARKERKVACGYHGFEPWVDKSLTIEDDLIRRDFTINAMAIDMKTGDFIDPFNGVQDLTAGLLIAVSEAFAEDPLRVYRGARFAAQFGFQIEYDTIMMMQKLRGELSHVTPERVSVELQKAMAGKQPRKFFDTLYAVDVLDVHFKEIANLIGVEQPIKYHTYDGYGHSIHSLQAGTELTDIPSERFAILNHDIGKSLTPRQLWPFHKGHEEAGVPLIEQMCDRLVGIPTSWRKSAMTAAKYHMKAYKWRELRPGKFVTMIEEVHKSALGLDGLAAVVKSDHLSRGYEWNGHAEVDEFVRIGKEMLSKVTGKTVIEKYGNSVQGEAFSKKLREMRTIWYKENYKQK